MFQGMARKRGRPPEQLPIGGYEKPNEGETEQIPIHQENAAGNDLSVQLLVPQQSYIISNSQDRRLVYNPLQVMI